MPAMRIRMPMIRCYTLFGILMLTPLAAATDSVAPVPGNYDSTSKGTGAGSGPKVQAHSPRDDRGEWTPVDFSAADPKLPTLVIAGDSTASTGDPAHRGWAAPLIDYFDSSKINLVNRAVGGRSARTFFSEGKWQAVVDGIKAGDFVVIEFGHNDGGAPDKPPFRGDLPGIGNETIAVTSRDGRPESVHTYGWYLRKFVQDVKAKGATPIVSSTTVRNIWKDGKVERGMGNMLAWARQIAEEEHVPFLDHSNVTADRYEKMGEAEVRKYFPADHTHTSTEGAQVNAETFVAGLKALEIGPLTNALNERGRAIPTAISGPG